MSRKGGVEELAMDLTAAGIVHEREYRTVRRPPVRLVIPDPDINYCPRQIPQHQGGCYCMTYICCGRLAPDPHAEDCGGVIEVHERRRV